MRKHSLRWLGVAFCLAWLSAPATAQLRFVTPAEQPAPAPSFETSEPTVSVPASLIDNVFRRASQFENEQRWGEALSVYEEALRENPNDQVLGTRHNLAKIQYDLSRRYSDSSFLNALTTVRDRQALELYSEVLLKIETHYVSAPQWQQLVARGTQDLDLALRQKQFRDRHLTNRTPADVDRFSAQLQKVAASRPVRTRQQAIDAVNSIAQYCQQQLGLSATAVTLEYACAAIGALDTYSAYLTSDQLNDVYSQIEGNFVGLGIELKADAGALLIVNVISGSPAERGGIRTGDRITAVDGKATNELTTDQAADMLQGPEGSTVQVVVLGSNNIPRKLAVRREHIDVPSVDKVAIIDKDYGIGYLQLTCFQKTTSRDLDAALWKLHREGMKSLIMDLRKNPGGLLTASVEVADKFVEDGVIVSTRGRSPLEDYNYTAHKAGTWRVPLVVLIDGDSASASEIFAGAIRDHRRGVIVGERSYGKGSVQGIFPLTVAGSGVRLTTAKFYSPNGHPISNVGVKPDIQVHQVAKAAATDAAVEAAKPQDDLVLNAGIQAARSKTAQR